MLTMVVYEFYNSKNWARFDTLSKVHAEELIAGKPTWDYLHWDSEEMGALPKETDRGSYEAGDDFSIPGYAPLRRAFYKMESDPMYSAYRGCVEDGDDEETSKALWTDVRDNGKTKYPKPE